MPDCDLDPSSTFCWLRSALLLEGYQGRKPLPSMKPSLSRPAAKILFFLFLIHFGRRLAATHLLGFGA
jgi:hypothetical protein